MARKHKNLLILVLGIAVGIFLYRYQPFHQFLLNLGGWGYLGAFIGGILYASTATISTSIAVLLILAQSLSRFEIAVLAGFGAVIGDFLIFRFVKDDLLPEFSPLLKELQNVETGVLGKKRVRALRHLLNSRYFGWLLPMTAAILIGSPFPDEIAMGILGATKLKVYQLIAFSFAANFSGIFLILFFTSFIG